MSLSAFERLAALSAVEVDELPDEDPVEEPLEADDEELDEVADPSSSSSCFISNLRALVSPDTEVEPDW